MADSITCPACHRTSHNPNDIEQGYCGHCHDWTGPPYSIGQPRATPTAEGPVRPHRRTFAVDELGASQSATSGTNQPEDLIEYLDRHKLWSMDALGLGPHTAALIEHITTELNEIRADPLDLEEWIDIIILAIDGAWRAGHTSAAIQDALFAKQRKNIARRWPDPATHPPDRHFQHLRDEGT
jgi:hypothetical protein